MSQSLKVFVFAVLFALGCRGPLDSSEGAESEEVVGEAAQALDTGAGNVDVVIAFCTEQAIVKDELRKIARHTYAPNVKINRLGRVAAIGHRNPAAQNSFAPLSDEVTHEVAQRVQISQGSIVVDCGPAFAPSYDLVFLEIPLDTPVYRTKAGPSTDAVIDTEQAEFVHAPANLNASVIWTLKTPSHPVVWTAERTCVGAHPHGIVIHAGLKNFAILPQCNNVRGSITMAFDGTKWFPLTWAGNVAILAP